jgi:hypothetical protein
MSWSEGLGLSVQMLIKTIKRHPKQVIRKTKFKRTKHFDDQACGKIYYKQAKFIPVIHSGKALLEKFDRLEEAKMRFSELKNEEGEDLSVEEVFKQKGFDSTRVIDSLVKDVMRPAQRLKLIDIKNEGQLAAKIADLYHSIEDERNEANMPGYLRIRFGGPLSILRDYIKWLEEQRWEASSNVLLPDSRAFAAFRRDFRALELFDPINGRD